MQNNFYDKNKTSTLNVDLKDRSYNILVGQNLIQNVGQIITPILKQKSVFIVSDENVAPLYIKHLENSLKEQNISYKSKILPAGEGTKTFKFFEELIEDMLFQKCERKTTIIALGGGVIGDITGFAASSLLRGVDFIQIPTSLLAQVDSSVGGKTGINTKSGKNLVGAFYQPKIVIADIKTLNTLDKRQLLAGYAEVLKYGLLGDKEFYHWCEKNGKKLIDGDFEARKYAVLQSCAAKADIVAKDEKENGVRALLNLGHTFAHAFEAMAGYDGSLLHGEAVAIGMMMAFELSAKLNFCKQNILEDIKNHYLKVGLPIYPEDICKNAKKWDLDTTISNIFSDKKVKDGKINFIMAKDIGQTFITNEVPMNEIRDIFKKYLKR